MEKTIFLPETIIDSHCHGRDMNESHKTTMKQTLMEAKAGNIGITVFMPNTNPPIIDKDMLSYYVGLMWRVEASLGMKNQYLYFGVTDDNLKTCEYALKTYDNVVGLKIYPKGVTTGSGIGISKDETIIKSLKLAAYYNKVVAIHCDGPNHTIEEETEYLKKVIFYLRWVPVAKVAICHISCRESAEIILRAQQDGLKIAIEICPHYLWFDDERTNWNHELDPIFYHCYNKLRSLSDRHYLTSLIRDDNPLVFVGSDNAPHTKEEKLVKKLGGLPTNQEMVAVTVTVATKIGLSEKQIGNLLCQSAANFLGIPVSEEKKEYYLEEKTDEIEYNHGKIVNPWNGSRFIFPVPINKQKMKGDNCD